MRTCLLVLALLSLVPSAFAQRGDKAGEKQVARVPKEKIPPAPPLSPADELKTFKLAPGFRAELVASDPMIETPIVAQFDAGGRLWVVEMPSYMLTPDGDGEADATGRISVIEDTDGDGRADKKTVFLDKLILPRALAFAHGGVLVCEPPNLWHYPVLPGLKPGNRTIVAKDYGRESAPDAGPRRNIEHTANSPMWGLDNFIYSANYTAKFRRVDDEWKRFPTTFRGQWGFSQDDWGRPFYNSNGDHLRTDLVPSEYYFRNPFHRSTSGLNVQPLKDQTVWPSRVNPGVNRGYQEKTLRPDGTLAAFTAACAPVIYRGDLFPAEFVNNAFVCEPAGNLIRRVALREQDGALVGENPYKQSEFMTSKDELFRPVNLASGPDGALYVVDMYHGLIQHRAYVTTYLRQQAEDRGLQKVTKRGRIWRIVPEGKKPGAAPKLASASPADLVKSLSHANGWVRSTAQRLLVEQQAGSSLAPLQQMAVSGATPLARLHALWTLDGAGFLDGPTVAAMLDKEPHPKVRAAAIRAGESLLKTSAKDTLLPKLAAHAASKDLDVQVQAAFTLGQLTDATALQAMLRLGREAGHQPLVRDALVSGLGGREVELLDLMFADSGFAKLPKPGADALVSALAKCVFTQARADSVNRLLTRITAAGTPNWLTVAVLNSLNLATPTAKGAPPPRAKLVRLQAEPAALALLKKSPDNSIRDAAAKLDKLVVWPGKPGVPPEPPVRPLNDSEQRRFAAGKLLYESTCAACHQPHGLGQEGLAPPLADSEWVAGDPARLARIMLHGVTGPLFVQGRRWNLDMPGLGNAFDDEALAGVLTYIRREWDHTFDPVDATLVKRIRTLTASRQAAWTEDELKKAK